MDKKAIKNFLNQALTFLVIFLIVNFIFNQFFNKPEKTQTGIQFYTSSKNFAQNDTVVFHIDNYTDHAITLKNQCPNAPVAASKLNNGQWTPVTYSAPIKCEGTKDDIIQPGEKKQIKLHTWSHELFKDLGNYKLTVELDGQNMESNQFEIGNMSFFGWLWTTIIYQPIYNALIFFASILPGYNLGLAIILLTILIRSILLFPNHKALKSQKKLQSIQHKISALKDKHGDDQQKIAQETFAIYKEHKVSPFSSCLPMLIQLPILIGLFNVIQNGMDPGSSYLLYGPLKAFDLAQVNTNFFGLLDLTKIDFIAMPIIVGVMQFLQVKLSFGRSKAKAAKPANEMEAASRTMMYVMPVMIAFFTASVPSGVGLYWAFSTLYGIIQQMIVNRQHESTETTIKVADDLSNKEKKELYKKKNEERKKDQDNDSDNSGDAGDDGTIRIIKA